MTAIFFGFPKDEFRIFARFFSDFCLTKNSTGSSISHMPELNYILKLLIFFISKSGQSTKGECPLSLIIINSALSPKASTVSLTVASGIIISFSLQKLSTGASISFILQSSAEYPLCLFDMLNKANAQ